jgi:hypothetical protein
MSTFADLLCGNGRTELLVIPFAKILNTVKHQIKGKLVTLYRVDERLYMVSSLARTRTRNQTKIKQRLGVFSRVNTSFLCPPILGIITILF